MSYIRIQTRHATTSGTAQGMMIRALASPPPRNFVFRVNAVPKPRMNRNATVTLCHTRTADLAAECRRAELLIAAAGRAGIIGANCLSPGQVVIDVGINVDAAGHLVGDVDFAAAEAVVGAVTPVPGGVGAVTTSVLARHVLDAAAKSADISL